MRPKNNPGIPAWRGDALRLRRIYAGWTFRQLAERVGVSKSTVSRWENGHNEPDSSAVAAISDALDLPAATFAREPRIH